MNKTASVKPPRRANRHLPRLEDLESRNLLAASITLDAQSQILSVVGTGGNDLVRVTYGETSTTVAGVTATLTDQSTIVVRVQSDQGGPSLQKSFPSASVKSIQFDGQGGSDFLSNMTTKVASWTTGSGGVVSTSLMVGSPGYRAPSASNDVGVFKVGPTGQVGIDYLFRGAGYSGQLAIFSLAGMEAYQPGSYAYIHEAARRALSESTQGHVVIKVDQEAAKYSATLPWDGNYNKGTYQGVHTVAMTPGDTFAAMLVPNGKVQTVFNSTAFAWDLRPLFSVPAGNPYPAGTQYLGQVGDLDGHGSLFAFEDQRLDGGSDRDYNDLTFQVTGARGLATPVSEVANASRDFRTTPIFQQIAAYATKRMESDVIGAIADATPGGFEAGASGKVTVDYVRDGSSAAGDVAIFSLQGMGAYAPGSAEFVKEAARRALTDSTLGHVVISDSYQSPLGGSSYRGPLPYAMTPGDDFGVLAVDSGTIWSVYTGARGATSPGVSLSIPKAGEAGSTFAMSSAAGGPWGVALGESVVKLGGATVNVAPTSDPAAAPASFCGQAYIDLDGNGLADPADPSLPGLQVTLAGVDVAGRPFSKTVVSAPNGCFDLGPLPAGTYSISGADLSGRTLAGGSQVGTNGGLAYGGIVSNIVLLPGEDADRYALGRLRPAEVRGYVYSDLDRDRVYDRSEAGLAGVQVRLTGVDDRGVRVDLAASTAADGAYGFAGLRPGVYAVKETQPAGWVDGRESIGTFLGRAQPISRNGKRGDDVFSAIEIRPGEQGYNYNFGEWTASADATGYVTEVATAGTEGADVVEILLGRALHTIRVNGVVRSIVASVSTILSFDGLGGDDRVSIVGIPGSESFTTAPGLATLIAPGLRVELNGVANVSFTGGMGDRAYLYDTSGDDVLTASPTTRTLDGPSHHVTIQGVERLYAYATAGGDDVALLADSRGSDTYKATPADARLYGDGFYNYARGFDRVAATSSAGGLDRAYLYDSAGDDSLRADPTSARLWGRQFEASARGFARVDAYSTAGGNDSAVLAGSAGDDRFYGGPAESQVVGTGFDVHAIGFAAASASGGPGGADRAYLTGTQSDDALTASSTRARLIGPGLDVTAEAFPWVMVSGGGCLGADSATLADSAGNDVLESSPNSARLYGPGYSLRLENFAKTAATSSIGGSDKAVMKDSTGDDVLDSAPGRARLFGRGFDNSAIGFAVIEVDGSAGGRDRATLADSAKDDLLTAVGSSLSLETTGATLRLDKFESVTATARLGKNRKKLSAIEFALEMIGGWFA